MSLDITITTSRHFLGWLAAEGISLAFTTYQNNRLFLLGLKDDHTLSTYERLFDRPMGLYVAGSHLYLSTRTQLWQLENALPPGTLHEGYDALYVPRKSHVTGDLDVHDCAIDHQGRLVFANTLYSCLATTSTEYSFSVLWKPPFISKLVAEDRCHLNGLAMENGVPRYVTTISRSDVASGWRQRRNNGGCLIDIQSNQIIQNQLSMPHSPRVHEGKIWILNSGSGEIGYVDNHGFSPVVFCPGYLRGMTLYKNFAIVGLSKPRYNKAFTGLTLDQQLQDKDAEAFCGLYIIDLQRGEIAHWVQLEGIITELYDVGVLQGVRRPQALGFRSDEIERYITFEAEQKLYFHPLSGNNRDDFSEGAGIDKRARDFSLPPMRSAQEITPPPAKQMPPQKARAKSTASLPHNLSLPSGV